MLFQQECCKVFTWFCLSGAAAEQHSMELHVSLCCSSPSIWQAAVMFLLAFIVCQYCHWH
jgi:hypothetical protein